MTSISQTQTETETTLAPARHGNDEPPRRRYELEDNGFKEVPKRWRKFYRVWDGEGDELAPNEVICPVCKVVVRSQSEYREGDRVYCMCCMTRMIMVARADGILEAEVIYQ